MTMEHKSDYGGKIMAKNDRFIKVYSQGSMTAVIQIWIDKQTGVNYIFHQSGYSGGLTPLLDSEGKVVITPIDEIQENTKR